MAGLATLVFSCLSVCQRPMRLDRRDAGVPGGLGLAEILTNLLCARCGVSERQKTGKIACPTKGEETRACRANSNSPKFLRFCCLHVVARASGRGQALRGLRVNKSACPTEGKNCSPTQNSGRTSFSCAGAAIIALLGR